MNYLRKRLYEMRKKRNTGTSKEVSAPACYIDDATDSHIEEMTICGYTNQQEDKNISPLHTVDIHNCTGMKMYVIDNSDNCITKEYRELLNNPENWTYSSSAPTSAYLKSPVLQLKSNTTYTFALIGNWKPIYVLTGHTTVNKNTKYYTREKTNTYTEVENPTGNPKEQGWYTKTATMSWQCPTVNSGHNYFTVEGASVGSNNSKYFNIPGNQLVFTTTETGNVHFWSTVPNNKTYKPFDHWSLNGCYPIILEGRYTSNQQIIDKYVKVIDIPEQITLDDGNTVDLIMNGCLGSNLKPWEGIHPKTNTKCCGYDSIEIRNNKVYYINRVAQNTIDNFEITHWGMSILDTTLDYRRKILPNLASTKTTANYFNKEPIYSYTMQSSSFLGVSYANSTGKTKPYSLIKIGSSDDYQGRFQFYLDITTDNTDEKLNAFNAKVKNIIDDLETDSEGNIITRTSIEKWNAYISLFESENLEYPTVVYPRNNAYWITTDITNSDLGRELLQLRLKKDCIITTNQQLAPYIKLKYKAR